MFTRPTTRRLYVEQAQDCRPQQRGLGFAIYRAALEREEHAAGIHSDSAERLGALAR
jgi:hypothetical protein